jgi:hypothetical protein
MRRIIIIMFLCLPVVSMAQSKLLDVPEDSVGSVWDLGKDAYYAWDNIDSAWMESEYRPILKKFKLKMSCSGCEYIMMHADLSVDSTGRLIEYRIVSSDKCGNVFDDKLKDAFMSYFVKLTFPQALRNRIFRVILGTGLKC